MHRDLAAAAAPRGDDAAPALPDADGITLVCDLDCTLIRTDMLYETFWAAVSANWSAPLPALRALMRGRAALKAHLAGAGEVAVADLPYEDEVIDRVRDWRARGGRTALVTGADQSIAERVAAHLGIFDEVHGSDGSRNLKGPAKAAFLEQRFGRRFAYIGDSRADLAVWEIAAEAITVNASGDLRRAAEARAPQTAHMGQPGPILKPALKAMRPHQWAKNVLIFLPVLAGHALSLATLTQAVLAFAAFSLVASSVYVLNDLLDLAADRAHPRKRFRPFASGALPLRHGTWMAPALLLAGVAIAALLGPAFLAVMAGYYLTTTAYSLWLKRQPVIDICTLAVLYAVRIAAGGAATGIELSVWLLAFSIFFFFSLAAVKRQAELVDGLASGRDKAAGRGYGVDDLPLVAMMATASGYVSVMVMALYVNSPAVTALYTAPEMLWGICGVLLYWLSRMVFITHRGQMHDDPVVFAARDRVSRVLFVVILGFFTAGSLL
ncbi:UbiA family prenyltransferase [Pseudooceanicola sp. 216_PA32_1]|uniref:UbiA family prenyltransferase n=1 Tax=Pseudooceanicola pacificus TaxID=2676438 RepID=A0A844W8Q2_9RHOB|nr:UbiA family prenyltransferase [Pseudooceanicola pacificus]MWB79224.1 UbiA family prenyltransferase [Pseudooceanicola pacificus]